MGLASLLGSGCTARSRGPTEETFRLRNAGRLHATRDTPEGYQEAAKAFAAVLRQGSIGAERFGDLINLARCLTLGGSPEEARSVLAEARKSMPAGSAVPIDVIYLEGLALKALKSYAEAAARFREVTERDPALEAAWYQLGSSLFLAPSHAEAVKAFEKLIELNPQHLPAHYKRSMAYRALGDAAKAEECMARFLELRKKAGQDSTEETAYERCKYTKVTLVPPAGAASEPPPIALELEDGTAAAGLDGLDATSVVLFDYDRDGDPDLYLVRNGPNKLLRNDKGRFTDVTELSDAGDPGIGIAAEPADFSNDGIPDLFVINQGPCVLFKGLGEGVFQHLASSGLALEGVVAARWADYDHDGDLDLVTVERAEAPAAGARSFVHRNNGDQTFTRQDDALPGAFAGLSESVAASDLDRGNDIDLLVGDRRGPVAVFLNLRKGPFRREAIDGLTGHSRIGVADLNGDGELDVVGAPSESAPLRVAWNGGATGPAKLPAFRVETPAGGDALGPASCQLLVDLDDDGDVDVLLGTAKGLVLFRNRGGRLERSDIAGADDKRTGVVSAVSAADVDGDGKLDLLVCGGDGRISLLRNSSKQSYPAVTLRPVGSRDNRDGIGTHVELLAGGRYQRRLVETAAGARFGLGDTPLESLDGFELLWPNGIEQPVLREELKWDPWRSQDVTQKRGLTVSCPFLYAHDGHGYKFLTDVVGIAPLDEWLPPGEASHLDPEEYVRIPSEALKESGGKLHLVITEELRETTYLDRVCLIRVTHPLGTLVFTDESTRQGAIEPLKVRVAFEEDILPARHVLGESGRDFTREARALDHVYLHPYGGVPTQWAGWVPSHTIEMEPPSKLAGPEPLLLLVGRIYWPDSSVTFALTQHGRSWAPPRLDAVDEEGRVSTVIADVGFPCGMDRTMLLPLPVSGSSLRLVTNHRFLWDRIAFVRRSASVTLEEDGPRALELGGKSIALSRETLPLRSADLRYHGMSRVVGDMERHEQTYDFDVTSPPGMFLSPVGRATRYGDVLGLVAEPDSRLAVLVPGDACYLELEAGNIDERFSVTYFLQITGWAKESNFHNPTGRSIEPLPFHGMDGYPPRTPGPARPEDLTRRIGPEIEPEMAR